MPEFEVTVVTVRSGTHSVRVEADDAAAARSLIQSDCDDNQGHCPPEWCTDDVDSDVADVRLVVLDGVAPIAADGVAVGTLYADNSLHRQEAARG